MNAEEKAKHENAGSSNGKMIWTLGYFVLSRRFGMKGLSGMVIIISPFAASTTASPPSLRIISDFAIARSGSVIWNILFFTERPSNAKEDHG